MNKNAIVIKKKRKLKVVQREFNKKSGEYDCVFREGGYVTKRLSIEEFAEQSKAYGSLNGETTIHPK